MHSLGMWAHGFQRSRLQLLIITSLWKFKRFPTDAQWVRPPDERFTEWRRTEEEEEEKRGGRTKYLSQSFRSAIRLTSGWSILLSWLPHYAGIYIRSLENSIHVCNIKQKLDYSCVYVQRTYLFIFLNFVEYASLNFDRRGISTYIQVLNHNVTKLIYT